MEPTLADSRSRSIDRAAIQAQRDAVAQRLSEAQQQYAQMEQALQQLDRQLCAMHGGLQALDELLSAPADDRATP